MVQVEKLSNEIKNPTKDKNTDEIIVNWLSDNITKGLQGKLKDYIETIGKCIDGCIKNRDNEQTQQ